MKCSRSVLITVAVAGLLTAYSERAALAASSLETFVVGTTGQSNYSTYRQPDPEYYNFGGFGNAVPSNPAGLAASGIAGEARLQTSTVSSSLTDAITATGTGRSGFGDWNYSGSARSNVSYGHLGAESHAVHTGNSDNATVNNADSYAIFRDSLNPSSPDVTAGASGTMRLAVTVSGAMQVSGTGGVGMLLRYGYGTPRPGYPIIGDRLLETFLNIYGNGYQIYGPHSSFGSFVTPPGMTLTTGTILPTGQPTFLAFGGTTTVYATLPVTFGADTDFQMGMLTWAGVGNGNGTMDTGFAHTATISGIELLDATGKLIPNFSIASGSGTLYTSNGVQTVVPEVGSLLLIVGGILPGLVWLRQKRG